MDGSYRIQGSRKVSAPESYEVLGFKITPMTIARILDLMSESVESQTTCVIASQNVHGLFKCLTDTAVRTLHERAHVHIDGMPLVWLARLCRLPVRREHRVALIDLIPPLLTLAVREHWRVFYLGGRPAVVHSGRHKLLKAYPGLEFDGHHGFFGIDSADNQMVVDRINAFQPHILMVGMGMGRQERWILEN